MKKITSNDCKKFLVNAVKNGDLYDYLDEGDDSYASVSSLSKWKRIEKFKTKKGTVRVFECDSENFDGRFKVEVIERSNGTLTLGDDLGD